MALIYCKPRLAVTSNNHKSLVTYVFTVGGEAMKYPRRQDNQILLLQSNPNPFVLRIPDIEEAIAIENISDLFILVKVLIEEHLHLLFVHIAHLVWRHNYLVSVFIRPFGGDLVNISHRGTVMVEDS